MLSGVVFFGWGEIFSLFPSTLTDTFGTKHATTNYGFLYMAQGIGSVLGGPVAALMHDATGSWMPVFAIVIAHGCPDRHARAGGAEADAEGLFGVGVLPGDQTTWNPCAKGSRSSMKMVLRPVMPRPAGDRGHDGVVVADASARLSTRPLNSEPMMLSWTKSSPTLSLPLGAPAAPCAPRCRCRRASGRSPCRRRTRRCGRAARGVARLAGPQDVADSRVMVGFSGCDERVLARSAPRAASGDRRSRSPAETSAMSRKFFCGSTMA